MKSIKAYLSLMRPKNWLKNIIIFVPIVFSVELFNINKLIATGTVFIAFCLITSAVYAFNDICDIEKDKKHHIKQYRPLPCGLLSICQAAVLAGILAAIGCGISFFTDRIITVLFSVYIVLNIVYSVWLKQIPIIDCFCIAASFILRIYIGSIASSEPVSEWLFLTVLAMSLFMAFGKRRGELGSDDNIASLTNKRQYSISFLNGIIYICSGLTIMFYSLWTMNRGHYMIFTVPMIIFLVIKYLFIIDSKKSYADPTSVIFEEKSFLVVGGLYVLISVLLLYTAV